MTQHATTTRSRPAALAVTLVSALAALVVLAANHDHLTGAGPATRPHTPHAANSNHRAIQTITTAPTPSLRFDGDPEEGTHGITTAPTPSLRFDGGPEEGTRGITTAPTPSLRFDGGPEEGTRGIRR
jgi:hypothetical protein